MTTSKKLPNEVLETIEKSQLDFRKILEQVEKTGGITKERYIRLMSMQYHLTKGVHRHFYIAASHPDFSNSPELRKFLVNFAHEEEHHYEIAKQDLLTLGTEPMPLMLDVKVWWAYFNTVITETPLVRLGATCILENITQQSKDIIKKLLTSSDFLTPKNTRFITIHQHETLPHGDQILTALEGAELTETHMTHLIQGTREGRTLYLRMASWVFLESGT